MIRIATLSMLVLGLAAATATASPGKLQQALDRAVAAGVPGAIVLVRDGDRTTRVTSGYGNVATKTPIRATDRFRVGSLTKTFVSTVVLQLVGEGKLSLDDSIEHWLPGLVPNGRNISVRRLLNMTSGLYEYSDDRDGTLLRRFQAGNVTYRYTPRELVGIATAHKPYFAPGKGWKYCNTCYILVGLVVEKASGHSIASEIRSRILAPLRLRSTSFDTEPQIAGRHSHGYLRAGGKLTDVSFLSPSWAWAAGAMVSTVDDIQRFYSALNGGRLLRPDLLQAMRTTATSGYGLGIARVRPPCGVQWGNSGDFIGYNAKAYGPPDASVQYVAFVNLDEASMTPRIRRALDRVDGLALCGRSGR